MNADCTGRKDGKPSIRWHFFALTFAAELGALAACP
jgi:hypothetical protein